MFFGKITGLARDIVLNAKMGADSAARTALDPALTIPAQFLDFAFAAALSSSFIPVFNEYLVTKGKKQAFQLADAFITVAFFASAVIVLAGVFLAEGTISLFAPGITNPETKLLAVRLIRLMLPTITLTALAFSFTAVLQSLDEFNIPAAMSVLSNIIIIGYFGFFYDKFGVTGLCIAFLVGWLTQLLVILPPLVKRGYIFCPKIRKECLSGLKQIGILTLPVMISTWFIPVNILVNKNAASYLYEGAGMNILTVANSLFSVITGVFIHSVANVIFPDLSRKTASGDSRGFAESLEQTTRTVMFFLIPMSAGLFVIAEPVVRLFYERGKFTPLSTDLAGNTLAFFAIGMVGTGIYTILTRACYAAKNAKIPVITSVVAIAINAVLSFPLTQMIGVGGAAAASSVSVTAAAVITFFLLRRQYKFFGKQAAVSVLKTCISSVLTFLAAKLALEIVPDSSSIFNKILAVFAPTFAGGVVFLVSSLILKSKELDFKRLKEKR
jgi:putative peptidoglycan lipid II flippase